VAIVPQRVVSFLEWNFQRETTPLRAHFLPNGGASLELFFKAS